MKLTRNPTDVLAGILLIGTALAFLWIGRTLRPGSITQMGPGYAPNLLCFIQILLGLGVLAAGFRKEGEPAETWSLRPVLIVALAIAVFAVSIEELGLLAAVCATVIVSGFASPESRHGQNLLLALFLALFSTVVFVKGLNLQIPVWPAIGRQA
jgi:Tripartite tricarboxylate transporter TctB family.|nr:MAG: tripartite tricarboxylate transporter TctB family protein [Pseudomonadota bacterium]